MKIRPNHCPGDHVRIASRDEWNGKVGTVKGVEWEGGRKWIIVEVEDAELALPPREAPLLKSSKKVSG